MTIYLEWFQRTLCTKYLLETITSSAVKKSDSWRKTVQLSHLGCRAPWVGDGRRSGPSEPCVLPDLKSCYRNGRCVGGSRIKSWKSQATCGRLSSIGTFRFPTPVTCEPHIWWFMQWFLGGRHSFNSWVFILICIGKMNQHLKSMISRILLIRIKLSKRGASLVAQWLRIRLPMQGTRVWALVREDPTCHAATKPVSHNYWSPHA